MAYNSSVSGRLLNDGGGVVYYCEESFSFETISGVFFILIFIFSITGNSLLLCVLAIYEDLKNVTNLFVLNLACSDLIFTVTLPFWAVYQLHHWVFGEVVCKLMTVAYIVGLYSSIILLTAMTVDRFITVVLSNGPNNSVRRQRCAVAACLSAWVISTAASVSDAISVQVEIYEDSFMCEDTSDDQNVKLGYYLQVSLLFFLPFVIIMFCYSAILRTVLQASNRRRHRTVAVVLCTVAAFFICWGPYNILLFIKSVYEPKNCNARKHLDIAYNVCRMLAYSHCCMNPLLYMISHNMRKHLFHLLRCEKAKRTNRERSNGQSSAIIQNVAFTAQNSAVMLEQSPLKTSGNTCVEFVTV